MDKLFVGVTLAFVHLPTAYSIYRQMHVLNLNYGKPCSYINHISLSVPFMFHRKGEGD